MPGLGERHHLSPLDPIELRTRSGFLEHAHRLVAGTLGEGAQIALLALAGLIGRGHPAVDRSLLSQLKHPGVRARKPALRLGSPLD